MLNLLDFAEDVLLGKVVILDLVFVAGGIEAVPLLFWVALDVSRSLLESFCPFVREIVAHRLNDY